MKRLSSCFSPKRKLAKAVWSALLIIAFSTGAFILYRQINEVPKLSGRIAYVKNSSLRIRDYDTQSDYLLSKNIKNPELISWSPLGRYVIINQDQHLSVFDLNDRSKIDINTICELEGATDAKWVGKTDLLVVRQGSQFHQCNFTDHKRSYDSGFSEGQIQDWVPLNKDYLILLTTDKKTSSITRLNLSNNTTTKIASEKTMILGSKGKYLWFAEDRNFVYLTPGNINRILLNEDFNTVYKNTVAVANKSRPLGWNMDVCVGEGKVFVPQNRFLVLENTQNRSLLKQISFTAPQEYSSFETDTQLEEGETYWELAERIFNDGSRWKEFYKYNTNREPAQLQIGTKIYVPEEEIKTFKDFQIIQTGGDEAIYIPQLFVININHHTYFLTYGSKENEILTKFSPNKVLFDTKRSLQNQPKNFLVISDDVLSVYSNIDTKVDKIQRVRDAIWDWSSGYCYNHKYGEVIPSAKNPDQNKRQCTDYMEVRQYGIHFPDVCEEDWSEKIVSGTTVLENNKLGISIHISRIEVDSMPNNLPYTRSDGTNYDYQNLGEAVEYSFYFQWKPEVPIEALKMVCRDGANGENCDRIVPSFGWIP